MTRVACLLVLTALIATACSSSKPRPAEEVLNPAAPEWVYNPAYEWDADDEPLVYYSSGRAPIFLDLDLAEEKALADGRADIGAFLEVGVQRLLEAYVGEAGDRLREGSLSSLINDQLYTRQIIDTTLSGVRIEDKWWDGDYYYVWLKYDAGDSFLGEFQASLNERLRADTRELTAGERDRMRDQLESLIRERRQQLD